MSVYESTAPRGGGVTVAAGLVAMVTVVGLFMRPLLAIDETRYAAVALEMMQRNDWLVPHLNGATYSHKPPLLFWLVMAGWKVFGVSEVWARLVGPLAGIVALALLTALSRALWPHDARTRGWAPLITVGALLWAAFGTLLMFDTLLACSALLALLGIVLAVEHNRRRGVLFIAAGITLGVLAKGPVILLHILPVALAAPWWATPRAERRWSTWYASLLGGVLLGACGALLWAIPAGMAGGPEYQRAIFLGQTTGRIANSFAHRRANWWYLPLLPALLFPWILWPESWRAFSALRTAPRDAGVRFCVVWAGAAFTLFSLISGKQVHYMLPLVPALALLLARGLSQREAADFGRPWLVALVVAALGGTLLAAGYSLSLFGRLFWWEHGVVSIGALWGCGPIAAGLMLIVWQRGRITRNAAVHALAISTMIVLTTLQLGAGRTATRPYDTRRMAETVGEVTSHGAKVGFVGQYNGEYHFAGRLRGVVIDNVTHDSAEVWLRVAPNRVLLRYDRGRVPTQFPGMRAREPFRNGWITMLSNAEPGSRGGHTP
jgi:4-amino-4-deoxy-L-arabinose transferase-like glycosyltransferase